MRPFYIIKNKHGFYSVAFVNSKTGQKTSYKSTHTTDYNQALMTATLWLQNGVPSVQARQAVKTNYSNPTSGINIKNLLERLTDSEGMALYAELSKKYGNTTITVPSPVTIQTPVVAPVPAPTPVMEAASVSESTETPKKKFIVHKKNKLVTSGMLPEDMAYKVYQPLNPECALNLCDFLRNFWTPEKSEYIQNKRAHKKSIGDYHCKEMANMVNRYWLPFFGDEFTVGQLTEQYLEDFLQELSEFRHLKGATINHARTCGATALKWLKNKGLIRSNPMANVEAFSKSDSVPRGIPDEKEIRALYELDWDSEVMYLAFNLSAFSGLRPGEISGLQLCDIDAERDIITIRHSWHRTGFLKSTKTNLIRKVPVAHNIILRLISLAKSSPVASENSFVFWSKANDYKPFLPQYYDDGFFEALHKIGVSEEERRERNIDFYSLRHFCATYLANMTDMRNVQAVLGHTTPAMTQHYANHMTDEHFNAIREIFEQSRISIIAA